MKKSFLALCLTCVLLTGFDVFAQTVKKDLSKPVPQAAQNLVADALEMAKRDRLPEAVAALKKAIAIAPDYVNAHAEYIQLKSNFLNRYDEARREYEDLIKKEPVNPVYPMALAIAQYQTNVSSRNAWLKKVVEIAPDWFWAHYARAVLTNAEKEPETVVAELEKYIEADGSWLSAYYMLAYVQQNSLKNIDAAVSTAEKLAARPKVRSFDWLYFWRLRFSKSGGTEEAKAVLIKDIERLTASTRDIEILNAARMAYSEILQDEKKAGLIEAKIRAADASWYPERGRVLYAPPKNISGVSRLLAATNRQFALYNKAAQFTGEMDAAEKINGLEKLFSPAPTPEMKRYLYEQIFKVAEKAGNVAALVKYGDLLYAIDSSDAAIPAKIAIALANKKDAAKALRYARTAELSTAVFRPIRRPANDGDSEEEWSKVYFPEAKQQKHYKNMRSLALDALGWSLSAAGLYAEAETKLRQSIELARTEKNLDHLAQILNKTGRKEEAAIIALESKNVYAESLKKLFKNEPAKDFELSTIDGRLVKLSDLKGKVVMIDFWATWCGPCTKSVPTLVKLYEKYKEQGFEILYVSVDEKTDVYKIAPYIKERNIAFPVLLDAGAKEQYNVKAFPTTIFIDKEGKVRFRDTGFTDEETPRLLETVAEILLRAG